MKTIQLTGNGQARAVAFAPGEALRERCGTKSVKDGCSPQRQCGC